MCPVKGARENKVKRARKELFLLFCVEKDTLLCRKGYTGGVFSENSWDSLNFRDFRSVAKITKAKA